MNPDWKDDLTANGDPVWDGEPSFTNYSVWKGTLDYIFCVDDGGSDGVGTRRQTAAQVSSVLDIPKAEFLEPGIPNPNFGSDHLALMASVDLTED